MMQYKGYYGMIVELDPSTDVISGEVVGIRDVVTFQGRSPKALLKAFKESVDDYLDFCKVRGEQPDKPFSGKFVVRAAPETHRQISILARTSGQSLNSWIVERLLKGGDALEEMVRDVVGDKGKPTKAAESHPSRRGAVRP